NHPEASGIEATGTMQAIITRVIVRKALHGIHLIKRNRNVLISDCHLYENRGIGIFLDKVNLHQINVSNCHISYNTGGGIVVRASEVRNLQVGTCDIEGNMSPDAPSTANIIIDTREGSVREGAIVGCTIQHFRGAPSSANVRFIGQSSKMPLKAGNFVIADNVLSDIEINIHLKDSRGISIVGNTFWQGYQHNLLVENSSQIVVGPNLFDRNPDYGELESTNSLLFRNSQECTLTGLHMKGMRSAPAALTLENCRWFNITSCTILDSNTSGILLSETEYTRVSDCLIKSPKSSAVRSSSIRVEEGRHNMISDNLLLGPLKVSPGSSSLSGNVEIE
ncbi:MAG: right-handed parallel beta-helix repeat-containing protein, partial [bacterium]